MTLLKDDHPILKQKAEAIPYPFVESNVIHTIETMFEVLKQNNGAGIAAPQIGASKRIIMVVMGAVGKYYSKVMINPVIVAHSKKTDVKIEQCLSYGDMKVAVKRYKEATVRYYCMEERTERTIHLKRSRGEMRSARD